MPKKLLLCLLLCLCLVPAVAKAQSKWLTADTKYLSLIFREQDQAAAAELAVFADDVVTKVAEYFSASLNEKIQVLLLGELDVANGYGGVNTTAYCNLFKGPSGLLARGPQ